jgi:hypothetical protein
MYVFRPKNLTPCRDSNPVSPVLEADAMTTMPRRQGKKKFLWALSKNYRQANNMSVNWAYAHTY